MTAGTRDERLREDLAGLERLRQTSTIFAFEPGGSPPDRYELCFHGRGVARRGGSRGAVEFIDEHRVDLRLPSGYPEIPPDLRWLTPILHPNVSFSGFIQLPDIGLPWDESVTLDVVCERLWDVARFAYIDLTRTTQSSARTWLTEQRTLDLPVDVRPLRDRALPAARNVIRYQRRGEQRRVPALEEAEILFIGEDTPIPPLPLPRRQNQSPDSNGILYIGDD